MARIVYVLLSNGGVAGGQKMALRHVETLNALGFDAVCKVGAQSTPPRWFDHRAPLEQGVPTQPDDIVVVPEDSPEALSDAVGSGSRVVVLCQNPYHCASTGGVEVIARNPSRLSTLIAVGRGHAALMRRLLPQAEVEVVRCFADERIFGPKAKELIGAYVPRKRPAEAAAIRR